MTGAPLQSQTSQRRLEGGGVILRLKQAAASCSSDAAVNGRLMKTSTFVSTCHCLTRPSRLAEDITVVLLVERHDSADRWGACSERIMGEKPDLAVRDEQLSEDHHPHVCAHTSYTL